MGLVQAVFAGLSWTLFDDHDEVGFLLPALVMVASAVFTGMAGGLYGAYVRNASIEAFGVGLLTMLLSIVLLGGTATIYGSLLAAAGTTGAISDITTITVTY